MKSPSANSVRNTNTSHPPLARNAQGHPIAMPDGAAWWSIKRETRGRPQVIKGPDGHPYRVALTATQEDLAETFGPGTYRLDALDALGNLIDYVTTIEVSDDATADDEEDDDDHDDRAGARGASTDLRFALQTIVEMSRAQSDSLRAISEAQADWLKGLANAKSLPRNAVYLAPPALPPPAEASDEDDDDDDDRDDEDERNAAPLAEPMPAWMMAVQTAITPAVEGFVSKLMVRNNAPEPAPAAQPTMPAPPAPAPPNPMIRLAEINERLSDSERRFLADVLRSRNGEALTAELLACSVDEAVELVVAGIEGARGGRAQPRVVAANKSELTKHVLAVAALLDADQRAAVLALIPRLPPDRLEQLMTTLLAMSVEDAAGWLRENLPSLCAEVAS